MTALSDRIQERLERTWEDDPGSPGFLKSVDHKRVGRRYLATAFVFFLLAGVLALVMRLQLALPGLSVLGPEDYNRFFTMHGTTMIFIFNTPVLAGFGNYLVPLAIGARDMAFPRMNALSYWIYAASAVFMWCSFLLGDVPDAGWFAYAPLSTRYSPGLGLDFWSLGIIFLGISTTVGGINFIVTILKMRAPGMTASRMPILAWGFLVQSFMILFSLPAITLGPLLLYFDRALDMRFFDTVLGGDPVLYQHLFWFWGHPEVYILFVPATAFVSMIVPVFARRELMGHHWVVASLVAIGFVSFGVWVHHMFAVGLPDLANSFFSIAGLVITIPSAIQIFAWLGTMWAGRIRWDTPLMYVLGFIVVFVLGGLTGVMVSTLPFDWAVTDSYFIVAHLHYVLIGGVVFPSLAAFYYWWPKISGWMLDERLGHLSFWVLFAGMHLTFFPQHMLGLEGMTRRIYTYDAGLGWTGYNLLSSIGAFVFAAGILVTMVNVAVSWRRREPAGPNPWNAETLEWATTSPPGDYNFVEIPTVTSRYPLWDADHHEGVRAEPGGAYLHEEHEHLALATAGVQARTEAVMAMPHPSYFPFFLSLALAVAFVGMLIEGPYILIVGLALTVVCVVGWHWQEVVGPLGEAPGARRDAPDEDALAEAVSE